MVKKTSFKGGSGILKYIKASGISNVARFSGGTDVERLCKWMGNDGIRCAVVDTSPITEQVSPITLSGEEIKQRYECYQAVN